MARLHITDEGLLARFEVDIVEARFEIDPSGDLVEHVPALPAFPARPEGRVSAIDADRAACN
jgi:hypothetical protein